MDGFGGLEVLRDVLRDNEAAWWGEMNYLLDLADHDRTGMGFREGIRVDLWRALGDSPGG